MHNPVDFSIRKLPGKGYAVEGEITVAGVIAAEDFRQYVNTLRQAQALAARMMGIETEARAHALKVAAARKAEAVRIRSARQAARAAAAAAQLQLF